MDIEALGKRAVACKHWRWMGGMAVLCISYEREGFYSWTDNKTGEHRAEPFVSGELRTAGPFRMVDEHTLWDGEEVLTLIPRISIPDITDPATLGCLLHLVEAAWGEHCELMTAGAHKHDIDFRWDCHVYGRLWHEAFGGQTRAECLVAALEAAP